jgi:lysyl-tRNA synthetase class II
MKDLPNKIYDGKNIQNIYSGDNELTPSKKFSADNKDLDMGDTVGVGGVEYRVVGFDSDGEPLVESE